MKAIYIGDNKLKEINEVHFPRITDTKEYPITGSHSFEVGKEYEYGKDFLFEHWCNNDHTLNGVHTKVKNLSLQEVKDWGEGFGCKFCYIKAVAIPLPKEPDEDELLWDKLIGKKETELRIWKAPKMLDGSTVHNYDRFEKEAVPKLEIEIALLEKLKSQFYITKK